VIIEAIKAAGYQPGKDIAIALDPAASSFYEDGAYNLAKSGQGKKTSAQMRSVWTEANSAWRASSPRPRGGLGCAKPRGDWNKAKTKGTASRGRRGFTLVELLTVE